MEIITKYKAKDGQEFLDKNECLQHELNLDIAESIMAELPQKPDSCEFSNGGGYIQHDKENLLLVRNRFLDFAKRYSNHKWIQESIDKGFDVDASWAARIIGECAPSSISKHWYRFSCIDKDCREYGQPYFASHPNKAKQVKLN